MMFEDAVHKVEGAVPFGPKAFPILIAIGDDFEATQICETPADVPRGVDFKILGTCIAMIHQKEP